MVRAGLAATVFASDYSGRIGQKSTLQHSPRSVLDGQMVSLTTISRSMTGRGDQWQGRTTLGSFIRRKLNTPHIMHVSAVCYTISL